MDKDVKVLVLFLIGMLVVFTIGEGITGKFFWKIKPRPIQVTQDGAYESYIRNDGDHSRSGCINLNYDQCHIGCLWPLWNQVKREWKRIDPGNYNEFITKINEMKRRKAPPRLDPSRITMTPEQRRLYNWCLEAGYDPLHCALWIVSGIKE